MISEEYAERMNFTNRKLRHIYFDNLQKIFRENILEKGTGQILLMVVLIVSLYLEIN